jgi:ribokinase
MTGPSIAVLGSCVVDLVVSVPRLPRTGETLIASDMGMFAGGKGLNQAIGAVRSGADATLIGRIGPDPFGQFLTNALDRAGVSRKLVTVDRQAKTGLGLPLVEPSGQNAIVFVSGANGRVNASDVAAAVDAISDADMLLLQLELPPESALEAAGVAAAAGTKVLLNSAPAAPIPSELVGMADVLVANEAEARELSKDSGIAPLEDLVFQLFAIWEPTALVVTRGEKGVVVHDRTGIRTFPAFAVDSIDAVGAGDAFCAALAVELCRGTPIDKAIVYGQAAGALTVTRSGAEPAIPKRSEIVDFINATGQPT